MTALLLALAIAIDVGKGATLIVEDLLRTEETGYLDGSVLYGVGGVDDVLLVAHGVVAADGARGSLTAVGDTCHRAHHLDSLNARDSHCHDGRGLHGGTEAGEEGLVDEVGVVLTENLVAQLHHLHAGDAETTTLKTVNDFANQLALYTTGFQ